MIRNHQHLLEKFYESDLQCIWERSGDITSDTLKLISEVREYAERNNLNSSFTNHDYDLETNRE